MPTEAAAAAPSARALDNPRLRRILRYVIVFTLATFYSSAVGWGKSYYLPLFASTLIVVMSSSAPSLGFAVRMVTKMMAFFVLGLVLMIPLHNQQLFGLALVGLIMFIQFYRQAEGKIPSLAVVYLVMGVTLIPAFGQSSMDVAVEIVKGQFQSLLALFAIIWIAFAILPEGVFHRLPKAPRIEGSSVDRAILALRPVVLLLPIFVYMLGSDNGIRYLVGYIQVAFIAQHQLRDTARVAAIEVALSAVYGGVASVILWWLMKIWPSLLWFTLLMALLSLIFASRIFDNAPRVVKPTFSRWMLGMISVVVAVFTGALDQGFTGDDADMKAIVRILDYALITGYTVFGILLYDAVVDRLSALYRRFARRAW